MRVLLTGNKGFIGQYVEKRLLKSGFDVVGYDIKDGHDILNIELLTKRTTECQVIIHLAAVEEECPIKTMNTNLLGTWNVLCAAKEANVGKVIFLSSVDSLGIFQGEGTPKYLPLDDNYPCHPQTPYSISKKLAEDMCCFFSESNGITIFCLKPPGVWSELTYHKIVLARQERPEYEWDPYWEYGAFIDVRDLAEAILASINNVNNGFHNFLLASNDITTSGMTSLELVRKLHPTVKWNGGKEYEIDLFKSLINTDNAKSFLNWSPQYSWARFINESK